MSAHDHLRSVQCGASCDVLPNSTEYASLSNATKKIIFDDALCLAGFDLSERNKPVIAKKFGWSVNTLKSWRDRKDNARAPSIEAYELVLEYIAIREGAARFGEVLRSA